MRLAIVSLVLLLAGCPHQHGDPTGSTCPPSPALTWDNFGQAFMTSYCTRCHASTLTGEARMGAPAFHDFDTVIGVRNVADHVDQHAAAGPESVNEEMPPDGVKPSLAERQMLGEWLACGAP